MPQSYTKDPVRWFIDELNQYHEIKQIDVADFGYKTKIEVENFDGKVKVIELMQVKQSTMETALDMVIDAFDLEEKPNILEEGTLFIV